MENTNERVDGVRLHFKDGLKAHGLEIYRGVTVLYLELDGKFKYHFFQGLQIVDKEGEDVEALVIVAHKDIDDMLDQDNG